MKGVSPCLHGDMPLDKREEQMNYRQNYVPAEHQQKIIEYIRQHGSAQIKELSEMLFVSEATVRRDLDELHLSGSLERTHGGAIYRRQGTSFERRYEEKMTLMEAEKREIATEALKEISPGDTLFLDSGTTSYFLGRALGGIPDLTVFTYDLMVAYSCELHPSSTITITGGTRRQGHNNVLLGMQAVDFIRGLKVDKVFLGADAVDLSCVSNSNVPEAEIKKAAVEAGESVYLLIDHTKIGQRALAKVCTLDCIDTLITDRGILPEHLAEMKKSIGRVIVTKER